MRRIDSWIRQCFENYDREQQLFHINQELSTQPKKNGFAEIASNSRTQRNRRASAGQAIAKFERSCETGGQ